jgi:hypothetical protein
MCDNHVDKWVINPYTNLKSSKKNSIRVSKILIKLPSKLQTPTQIFKFK